MKLRNSLFRNLVIFTMLCMCVTLTAQDQLQLIHAQSDLVAIRDGDHYNQSAWTLAPEYNPDVYASPSLNEYVTFYTDLDSISFKVEKDAVHDFIILLNNQDTCHTRIEYKPSHLDVLKDAAAFDSSDSAPVPEFTYQDSSDANLKALRQHFKLDSIAGTGNEVSRLLNVMHWIHSLVPHDGNHENPPVRNALNLISTCQKDDRGLNCRGLATVLNECYLALGFKSRHVTCMPKDTIFSDCHVINTVYSQDLQKWIWLDPTHNAYVLNEQGELLGPGEVRERLINDQPLILNPNANWNYKVSTLKENYLEVYMAKNLYRMESPLNSTYDLETRVKGKTLTYVELLPLDGYRQSPKRTSSHSEKTGVTYKQIRTNDPAKFWTTPE